MPKLNQVRCVLAVNDHRKSADFYREKLGFKLDLEVEGWFFLSRDNFKVMLDHCPDEVAATNRPWGTREFSIETPDGHRIMFGQEINVP